jgi:hypothetical protein
MSQPHPWSALDPAANRPSTTAAPAPHTHSTRRVIRQTTHYVQHSTQVTANMASNDASAEREEVWPKHRIALRIDILTPQQQRLKSALWYTIGQYIDDECLVSDLNATPQFIGALTELVYTQIGTWPSSNLHYLTPYHHLFSFYILSLTLHKQTQHETSKSSVNMRAEKRLIRTM